MQRRAHLRVWQPRIRTVWQSRRRSRPVALLKRIIKIVTFKRFLLALFVLPILFYVYREVTRDVLIIDPFTVPKRFEEAGITSEVMANRIGDTFRQIEQATRTMMRKDNLSFTEAEGSLPDIEIPGTKLGLKTVVDISRSICGIYPKHISGDIVLPATVPVTGENSSEKNTATVTIYVAQGRNRGPAISVVMPQDDVGFIVRRTAETILGQVNPFLLATYRYDHQEYGQTGELVQQIIQNPSSDRLYKAAAYILWGYALDSEGKHEEAIAKFQTLIKLDPKGSRAYTGWGDALDSEGKHEEAIAKFQKSIELDPHDGLAYNNWGVVLYSEGKHEEAIAKYQKSIEVDPEHALAYLNWGVVLADEGKRDEAIAKFQKSIEVEPNDAMVYTNWGVVLEGKGKHEEAIAKFQKSIEVDPEYAQAYFNWGVVLQREGKDEEAIAKYQKSIKLDPKYAPAYISWGNVLDGEGKHKEAIAKFNEAKHLSQP
jgi:tetratricopeptide (TPR) repeat protein